MIHTRTKMNKLPTSRLAEPCLVPNLAFEQGRMLKN